MGPKLLIFICVFLPLVACPAVAFLGRALKHQVAWVALVFPLASTAALAGLGLSLGWSGSTVIEVPWIPSLGIQLSFLVDGLSLFFGFVVAGMGAFIFFYARQYLSTHYEHQGRFYCYLLMFMSAMLGTVLANNLMLLFVFWELTGLASFLLIGFTHTEEQSREGARMAFLVTGLTGLVLLAGVILIQYLGGTYDLHVLLNDPSVLRGNRLLYEAAFLLVIIGAFGKSAQFPFHFWLPNAMAAPTPVSAYLHSATMVKMGIFLTARVYQLFVACDLWAPVLIGIGFLTMALGAVFALLSHDLKAILAYSTVSQLGFLIGVYGLGSAEGVEHDLYHILNHVFYKGSLFMVAGIVDHAAGTRDIRRLGGLFSSMPFAAMACLIAGAGMAAIPGTSGFISKELVLVQVFARAEALGGIAWLVPLGVGISAVCLVAFSLRLFLNTFCGPMPEEVRDRLHAPGLAFQLPPFIISLGVLAFGVVPAWGGHLLEGLRVQGLHAAHMPHLAVWHGLSRELLVSAAALVLGAGLYGLAFYRRPGFAGIPRWLKLDDAFFWALPAFTRSTKLVSRALRVDRPQDYLAIIIAFILSITGTYLLVVADPAKTALPALSLTELIRFDFNGTLFCSLVAICSLSVVFMRRWTTRLIALSTVGFLVTLYFMVCRAPDLALTQMLVESATLILMLLLLGRFPEAAEKHEIQERGFTPRKGVAALLGLGTGFLMFYLVVMVTANPSPQPMGPYFVATTLEWAHGANAVNTILVDYRGFDTLGEITVLVISLLGAMGLFMRWKDPEKTNAKV